MDEQNTLTETATPEPTVPAVEQTAQLPPTEPFEVNSSLSQDRARQSLASRHLGASSPSGKPLAGWPNRASTPNNSELQPKHRGRTPLITGVSSESYAHLLSERDRAK